MTYVVKPRLARECNRAFNFHPTNPSKPRDLSCSQAAMEIQLAKAHLLEDPKKALTKAKAGDRLVLVPELHLDVVQRIVHVECHASLYENGVPTFKRIYKHGDRAFAPFVWECLVDTDLKNLPYLYETYIVDLVVR